LRDQGAALGSYLEEILETAERIEADERLKPIAVKLKDAVSNLQSASHYVIENAPSSQKFVGAVAYNFLMMMGYVAGAWYMARSAEKAVTELDGSDKAFYERKLASVNFYFAQLLPRHKGYQEAVIAGAEIGVLLNEACF
jgi:hypothetical protein